MKTIVAFAALVAVVVAAPQQRASHAQAHQAGSSTVLLKEVPSNNLGLDGYHFAYELSDGQKREEVSQIEIARGARANEDAVAINRVSGFYSWVDPADGQTYSVNYTADENGFHPQGAHLPSV